MTIDLKLEKALRVAAYFGKAHPEWDACDIAYQTIATGVKVAGGICGEFDCYGQSEWPEFLAAVRRAVRPAPAPGTGVPASRIPSPLGEI